MYESWYAFLFCLFIFYLSLDPFSLQNRRKFHMVYVTKDAKIGQRRLIIACAH